MLTLVVAKRNAIRCVRNKRRKKEGGIPYNVP